MVPSGRGNHSLSLILSERMYEDLRHVSTDFYKSIVIYEDPSASYRAMQIQLHTFPLLKEERYRLERITTSMEVGAARKATIAIRKLQEILGIVW